MNATQYRAYFFDPDAPRPDRPEQIFASDQAHIKEWAKKKLNSSGPNAEVWLYELQEVLIGSWYLPTKKSAKEACVENTGQPQYKERKREQTENAD